jgi:predicted ester cyclase
MSAETDLVQKCLEEVFNKGTVASIDNFFVAELHDTISQAIAENRSGFPDLSYKIDSIAEVADLVAFSYTATGTHKGVFENNQPTGKAAQWQGSVIATVRDGKIVHIDVAEDNIRRSLGLGLVVTLTPEMTGTWVGETSGLKVTLHLTQSGNNITGNVTITGFHGQYPVTGTNKYPDVTLHAAPEGLQAQFVGKFKGSNSVPGVLTMMGKSLDVTIDRQ